MAGDKCTRCWSQSFKSEHSRTLSITTHRIIIPIIADANSLVVDDAAVVAALLPTEHGWLSGAEGGFAGQLGHNLIVVIIPKDGTDHHMM